MNHNYSSIPYILLILLTFTVIGIAQTIGNPDTILPGPRAQIETPIAINPTDPNNLIGAAITQPDPPEENRIGYYYSFDGGATWNGNDDINGPGLGDPVVVFDPDGNAYLLYQKQGDSGLYLHKSSDGGVSWSGPITVVSFNPNEHKVDRPWMAIGQVRNVTTGYFEIYVSLTLFEEPTSTEDTHIRVYKSSDGGQTFSVWYSWNGNEFEGTLGSFVAVGPSENVFISFAKFEEDSHLRRPATSIFVSGRESNGTQITSFELDVNQIGTWSTEGGNWYLKGSKIRVDSNPRIAVDNSLGNTQGNVYVVWSDKQPASGDTPDIMILIGEDTGSGYSWSTTTVDGASGDQWMPGVSVSPDGVVSVLYYSSNPGASDPIRTYLKYSSDGGGSFSNRIEVGTNFTVESGGTTFLGDYHGLTSWYGKAYALWCENRDHGVGNNKRLAYFNTVSGLPVQIPAGYTMVTVDQVDESSQSFETIGRWNQEDFTNYKVPYDFVFEENSSEVLKAEQGFKTGTSQKHNQWLVAQVFHDIINHKSFTISNNQPDITGSFKTAHNATIQTEFITINQMNTGEVQFKDPWLRIDGDPQYFDPPYGYRNLGMSGAKLETYDDLPLELFTSSNFKGVFLDQDYNIPDNPYYTVAAPDHVINGVTYFLSDWSAENGSAEFEDAIAGTTAVIFRQPNAVVTAHMKGHLASNTSIATAYNNGRKVTADQFGRLHMVYEDNCQIYYTYSTNNGNSWSPEERVSNGDPYDLNRYPSIHVEPISPYRISIAWDVENSGHAFKLRVKPFSGNWGEEYVANLAGTIPTKPAIHRLGYLYLLAKIPGGIGLYRLDGLEPDTLLGIVPETDNNSQNSTITAFSSTLYFAWEQRNQVYFSYFLPPSTFGEAEEVTLPSADIEINQQPSISYSYAAEDPINIAWSGFDTDINAYVLLHRQRGSNLYSGQWGELNEVYYSYSNILYPSMGSFETPYQGWLNVAVKFGSDYLRVIQYNTQTWNWLPYWIPGSHPSLNDQGANLMLVGTDNTEGLPYPITSQLLSPGAPEDGIQMEPSTSANSENIIAGETKKHFRKEIFHFSNLPGLNLRGKVDIAVGDLQIQTTDSSRVWPFTAHRDTLRHKTFLQTEPLVVTSGMQTLTLRYQAQVRDFQKPGAVPALPLFRLRLLDAASGHPLVSLRSVKLNELSGPQFLQEDSLLIDLQPYQGQELVLQMQTIHHLLAGQNQKAEQVNRYEFYPLLSPQAKIAGNTEPETISAIPEEFALSQNYPNPFNPTTHHHPLPPGRCICKLTNLRHHRAESAHLSGLSLSRRGAPAGVGWARWPRRFG